MQALTRGYTRGLLTFDYRHPLSLVRENYLVNYLEREEMAEVLKTRSLILANLLALPRATREASEESFKAFKSYTDLILPNDEKSANIKEMTQDERIQIRETLREATKKAREDAIKKRKTRRIGI